MCAACRGCHACQSVHRAGERTRRVSRRSDRCGRRGADDADADPAVRRDAVCGDLQRPGCGRRNASVRRRRPSTAGNREHASRRLAGARLGTDGVPRRLPAARARRRQGSPAAHRGGARRGAPDRGRRDGAALHPGPALRRAPRRDRPRCDPAPRAHRGDRHDRWGNRGDDLGRLGIADDHPAAVPLPDAGRQRAGRHRPHPGGPADRRRRARRACVRARRVRRDRLDHHRQRAGGDRGGGVVIERRRPLHQARDHVRHLRVGAEVRRP
jgi:hypothetical protein